MNVSNTNISCPSYTSITVEDNIAHTNRGEEKANKLSSDVSRYVRSNLTDRLSVSRETLYRAASMSTLAIGGGVAMWQENRLGGDQTFRSAGINLATGFITGAIYCVARELEFPYHIGAGTLLGVAAASPVGLAHAINDSLSPVAGHVLSAVGGVLNGSVLGFSLAEIIRNR